MNQIGTPLDDATLSSLPQDQQDVLKAFFGEAKESLRNPDILQKDVDGIRFIPSESLQDKFDVIIKFGGDQYCPVRQCAQMFAFEETARVIN